MPASARRQKWPRSRPRRRSRPPAGVRCRSSRALPADPCAASVACWPCPSAAAPPHLVPGPGIGRASPALGDAPVISRFQHRVVFARPARRWAFMPSDESGTDFAVAYAWQATLVLGIVTLFIGPTPAYFHTLSLHDALPL